jgi:hypothetical protein
MLFSVASKPMSNNRSAYQVQWYSVTVTKRGSVRVLRNEIEPCLVETNQQTNFFFYCFVLGEGAYVVTIGE